MSCESLIDINRNKEYTTLPLAGTFGYISLELLTDINITNLYFIFFLILNYFL